jgi:hypothetical protein
MNIIERLIKLTVDNGQANTALVSTEKNLNKVDTSTTKVTQSTKTMTKETHNATSAIVKNGGAMGVLNELTGGLAMTFKDVSEAMELAGLSLNSFKGIMVATGIGALVIAVGALASNWDKVSEFLGITNKRQEEYLKLQNQMIANNKAEVASNDNLFNIMTNTNLALADRQAALDLLSEKVGALKDLKIGIDDKAITDAVGYYEDLTKAQEALTNETKLFTEENVKLNEIQNKINDIKKFTNMSSYQASKLESLKEEEKTQSKIVNTSKDRLYTASQTVDNYRYQLKLIGDIGEKNKKDAAAEAAAKTKAQQLEEARIARLTALREANNKKLLELDDDTAIKKLDRQEKYALRELEIVRGNERDKNVVRSYYERLRQEEYSKGRKTEAESDKKAFEDWQANLVKQWEQLQLNKQQEIELQRITNDAKFESWMRYWDDVAMISETSQAFLQALQDESLIKSKDVRNAILLLEKGMAIANVWITEAQASAVAKQNESAIPYFIQTYPGGPSVPNPAKPFSLASTAKSIVANKINAGIATASILAQTISSFSKSSGGSSSAGGSGGGTGSAPQFNIVGASGNNQLAAAIGAQQNMPVNAYVVGSSMTTQQALDRNRTQTATFL